MSEKDWQENEELPFHTPEEMKEEYCRYECPECGFIDKVPAFIVDEFAMDKKEEGMPGIVCPKCNGEMKYKDSFKR